MTKIAQARALVDDLNKNLGETESKINWDSIEAGLRKIGAVNEQTLKMISWEDLQDEVRK